MKYNELVELYKRKKSKSKSLVLELQELKELGSLPRGNNDGMPKSKNNSSPVENYVLRVMDIQNQLKELDAELLKIRDIIMVYISMTQDSTIKRILELCVFRSGRKPHWKLIAGDVGYSVRHTQRLYDEGINQLQKIDLEVQL